MYSNRVSNVATSSWLQAGRPNSRPSRFDQGRYDPNFLGQHTIRDSTNPNQIEEISAANKSLNFNDPAYQSKASHLGGAEDPLQLFIRQILEEEKSKMASSGSGATEEAVDTLGVSGLKYVIASDGKQPVWCKWFWGTLLLACLSANIYQLHDRFTVYFDYGIASGISLYKNRSLTFPLVYICPMETTALVETKLKYLESIGANTSTKNWCRETIVSLADLVGFDGLDAEAVWKMTSPSINNVFATVEFRDYFPDLGNFARIVTMDEVVWPVGMCGIYTLNTSVLWHGILTQMFFESKISTNSCETYDNQVVVEQELEPMKLSQMMNSTTRASMGYHITVMQFNGIDSPNMPCVSSEKYRDCWVKCANYHMGQTVKCRLPYMELRHLPMCKTGSEAKEAHKVAINVYRTMNESAPDCSCVRRCLQLFHQVYPKRRDSNNNSTRLSFYYASNYFDIVQERLIYEFTSLLCEAGGNIGLYIGVTMMSLIEVFKLLCSKLKNMIMSGSDDSELAGTSVRQRRQIQQVAGQGQGQEQGEFGSSHAQSPRVFGGPVSGPQRRVSIPEVQLPGGYAPTAMHPQAQHTMTNMRRFAHNY